MIVDSVLVTLARENRILVATEKLEHNACDLFRFESQSNSKAFGSRKGDVGLVP